MEPVEADGADPRQRLLDAAVDHVAEHGITGLSLRQLATAIGTSHRMLLYHFGSKEALMVAIVGEVEARTRATMADIGTSDLSVADAMRSTWAFVSAPENHAHERLFFELYGLAVHGTPGTEGMLDALVGDWLEPLAAIEEQRGLPPEQARANIRIGMALSRGLLLDLLATGDQAGVDAAYEHFVTHYDPG